MWITCSGLLFSLALSNATENWCRYWAQISTCKASSVIYVDCPSLMEAFTARTVLYSAPWPQSIVEEMTSGLQSICKTGSTCERVSASKLLALWVRHRHCQCVLIQSNLNTETNYPDASMWLRNGVANFHSYWSTFLFVQQNDTLDAILKVGAHIIQTFHDILKCPD